MIKIDRFLNYLNESLGVVDSTIFYVDIIKSRVIGDILDHIRDNPDFGKEVFEIKIPYTNIRRFITDWDLYSEFPVSEIVIYLAITMKPEDKLVFLDKSGDYIKTRFKVGGSAYPFAKGREKEATRIIDPIKMNVDHSLSIHMGLEIEYSNFSMKYDEKKLEAKIESVLLHELNHLYEYYCRKFNKKSIDLALTYASIGPNKMKRPKKIWDYWQYFFTDMIYMSEPHEIRAYVQETKGFVDKLDFASLKRTKSWKIAKSMQNFDYKEFIVNFNKIIASHNPDYVDRIIDMLVKDFINDYEKIAIEFKEDTIVSINTLKKMPTVEFFKFWEKRIKKAGETIVRKIIRLYSLKKKEEEEII